MKYAFIRFDSKENAEAFSRAAHNATYPNDTGSGRMAFVVIKVFPDDPWLVALAKGSNGADLSQDPGVLYAAAQGKTVEYFDEGTEGVISDLIYSGVTSILNVL